MIEFLVVDEGNWKTFTNFVYSVWKMLSIGAPLAAGFRV